MASLTAAETIRQPVCLLLTIVCVVITMAVPLISAHNFGDGGRLARDSGLAFHLVFGMFIAGYAACAALERERKTGTMAAVLSKPVGRGTFFLAKFIGITAVIFIFSVCASLTTLLAERTAIRYSSATGFLTDFHVATAVMLAPAAACAAGAWLNYRRKLSFQSTSFLLLAFVLALITASSGCFSRTGAWNPYHPQLQWQILTAAALITAGLTMFAAIALTLAVRLSLTPVIFICLALLITGLASDYIFGRFSDRSAAAHLLYTLVPNWQNFWTADTLAAGGHISLDYIARTLLYSLLYTGGTLCLGTAAFKHSEVS